MSITSGFYNSLDGDRRYTAEQMSDIFNGIINDGVFASVGTAFFVSADTGNNITVGVGRAWFNSTWIYNDSVLTYTAEDSDAVLGRYDAVVLEIDRSIPVRNSTIKLVKGTESSTPSYPTLIDTPEVHQYPLAYIYRAADSSEITQADITNTVGTSSCPFITGILNVMNIDDIVAQWMDEWEQLTSDKEAEFDAWFESVKGILDEEAAAKLANRIANLEDGTTPAGAATTDGEGNVITETYALKEHSHDEYADADHDHAASDITAGTFAGKVLANATSVATVETKQVRNIYAGTTDMTAGTTTLASGDIYVVYE